MKKEKIVGRGSWTQQEGRQAGRLAGGQGRGCLLKSGEEGLGCHWGDILKGRHYGKWLKLEERRGGKAKGGRRSPRIHRPLTRDGRSTQPLLTLSNKAR